MLDYLMLEINVIRRLVYARYERQLNRTYQTRLAKEGYNPRGVFWRSKSSQVARFDSLLSLVHKLKPKITVSIADIGCGYGAMFEFISSSPKFNYFDYHGVDINSAMIEACQKKYPSQTGLFSIGNKPQKEVDFCLFSGTFNLTHSNDSALWTDYVFSCLKKCMTRTRHGLVLNLLCTPKTKIQKQIFYINRAAFISQAEAYFGSVFAQKTNGVIDDVSFVITRS